MQRTTKNMHENSNDPKAQFVSVPPNMHSRSLISTDTFDEDIENTTASTNTKPDTLANKNQQKLIRMAMNFDGYLKLKPKMLEQLMQTEKQVWNSKSDSKGHNYLKQHGRLLLSLVL